MLGYTAIMASSKILAILQSIVSYFQGTNLFAGSKPFKRQLRMCPEEATPMPSIA